MRVAFLRSNYAGFEAPDMFENRFEPQGNYVLRVTESSMLYL